MIERVARGRDRRLRLGPSTICKDPDAVPGRRVDAVDGRLADFSPSIQCRATTSISSLPPARRFFVVRLSARAPELQTREAIRRSKPGSQLAELPRFRELLAPYAQPFAALVLQSVACNAVHSVQDRAAASDLGRPQWGCCGDAGTAIPCRDAGAQPRHEEHARAHVPACWLHRLPAGEVTVIDGAELEAASCECDSATRTASKGRGIML